MSKSKCSHRLSADWTVAQVKVKVPPPVVLTLLKRGEKSRWYCFSERGILMMTFERG